MSNSKRTAKFTGCLTGLLGLLNYMIDLLNLTSLLNFIDAYQLLSMQYQQDFSRHHHLKQVYQQTLSRVKLQEQATRRIVYVLLVPECCAVNARTLVVYEGLGRYALKRKSLLVSVKRLKRRLSVALAPKPPNKILVLHDPELQARNQITVPLLITFMHVNANALGLYIYT